MMPFREYAPFFGPEELNTLTAAFDATWQELSTANPDLSTEDKAALMKKKLAPHPRDSHGRWRPRRGNTEGACFAEPRWRFSPR
jgi:hypothetical protein